MLWDKHFALHSVICCCAAFMAQCFFALHSVSPAEGTHGLWGIAYVGKVETVLDLNGTAKRYSREIYII